MENKEILYNLNEETRKYLNDAFSYLDHFTKGKKVSKDEMEDYISQAFLLSILKNKSIFDSVFATYGITYESISKLLLNGEVEYKNAEDTEYLKNNQLTDFIRNIYSRLRYNNYLENTNILLSELQSYQIFDYITENYFYGIDGVLKRLNVDFVDELVPKITKMTHDYDSDFAYQHGVDIAKESEKENKINDTDDFDFDYCKVILTEEEEAYIVFKPGFDYNKSIVSGLYNGKNTTNDQFIQLIEPNKRYKVEKLCGFSKFNKHTLEKIFSSDRILDAVTICFINLVSDEKFNITFDSKHAFHDMFKENKQILKDAKRLGDFEPKEEKKVETKTPTPYLDQHGIDLINEKYLKDPSVGRDDEIRELEKILLYPEKDKSILITGIAGCGKTALVKGLAYRIKNGDVPKALKNIRIVSINCANLVAGTKYVGTLEKKMENILKEASSSKDIILFIDEIHQALGAGKSEGNNNTISEILKPYLDYGAVRVIGATTTDEYYDFISVNPAFETRFKHVKLKEPDESVLFQIADDLIDSYNKFSYSKLLLPDDERIQIIRWLIATTRERNRERTIESSNPRLLLDIIKDAYALAALDDRTEVTYNDLKVAVKQENRLYNSSREGAINRLNYLEPIKNRDNIIDFRLILKK